MAARIGSARGLSLVGRTAAQHEEDRQRAIALESFFLDADVLTAIRNSYRTMVNADVDQAFGDGESLIQEVWRTLRDERRDFDAVPSERALHDELARARASLERSNNADLQVDVSMARTHLTRFWLGSLGSAWRLWGMKYGTLTLNAFLLPIERGDEGSSWNKWHERHEAALRVLPNSIALDVDGCQACLQGFTHRLSERAKAAPVLLPESRRLTLRNGTFVVQQESRAT
jgi:hypothetical protein